MSNRQDDSRCHKACHLALFQGFPKLLDESSCCFSLHQACLKHFRLVSVFFDGQQSCSTRTVQAIAASRASSSSTREELLSLNAPSFCHTAYDFFLPLRRLIYAKPYEPQTARPHTAGDAGDVGVADSELRFFLGNLRVCSSRAGRELSNEPPAGKIARLDFENGGGYEFGYLFALRESSWAGALAPARFIVPFIKINHRPFHQMPRINPSTNC